MNTVIDVTAALVKRDPVVVQLERARDALAKATAIHQVKGILDVAAAGEIYARRRQLGEEALAYAHTVKIEALARLGELLRDRKSERSDGSGSGLQLDGSRAPLRSDSPRSSMRWALWSRRSQIASAIAGSPT